ncbi:hypothetical protein LL972_06415 [Xanthomonas campestris pv. asclepiadis]|uniref:hypothetical protein n=1 Tax=Xanthomonas campestris TaxID=339 RepID=UPI001E644F6D|nr:hypothetical protein [Xanthomonas campestris]MCC4615648.1 hypothetical protein [Xanthomonas campestris pv. asclepiadis]
MKNVVNASRRFASSTAGKVTAGVSSLVASGAAFASGGGSPGAAIASELSGGKTDVMLVIGACAVILGAIILWAYVKRAR